MGATSIGKSTLVGTCKRKRISILKSIQRQKLIIMSTKKTPKNFKDKMTDKLTSLLTVQLSLFMIDFNVHW